MSLQTQIQQDLITAMKAKDAQTVSVLRNVIAAVKNAQIDKQGDMTDDDVSAVIATMVKQLKDAQKDFASGGRDDLVAQNDKEIAILAGYLPEQLSDDKLAEIVTETIAAVGATSPEDMGKVMGTVMSKVGGTADGNRVKDMVLSKLES